MMMVVKRLHLLYNVINNTITLYMFRFRRTEKYSEKPGQDNILKSEIGGMFDYGVVSSKDFWGQHGPAEREKDSSLGRCRKRE